MGRGFPALSPVPHTHPTSACLSDFVAVDARLKWRLLTPEPESARNATQAGPGLVGPCPGLAGEEPHH